MSTETRKYATTVFDSLNDEQLMDFLKLFADDNTLALYESEMIAKDPSSRKQYDSLDEILKEIDEEESQDGK